MPKLRTRWLVRDRRANAFATWTLLGLATAAGLVALLGGTPLRAAGIGLLVLVAAVPSRPPGTWRRTFVWPLVFVVTLPAHVVAVGAAPSRMSRPPSRWRRSHWRSSSTSIW
ncbi:hypothetical protein ACFQL1_21480 [Halomicroarcula sp. GCM10025709]|uniref:hypothetical protein n=1 Tax=Halomicroarcula sp. GCM10025709 TaxID=3252669 RepID=UPI003616EB77